MNEEPNKRPIQWLRLWPLLAFAVLIAWEFGWAAANDASPDWVWIGIAVAGAVLVIILRVFLRV